MRAGRRLAALTAVLLSGAGAVGACTAYRVWQQGETDDRRPVDAIVVMGAAHYRGSPSPVFAARLEHAVALYEAGLAPYLVVTGGRAPGDALSEADAGRAYALRRGVPAEAILDEDEGRDTLGSIRRVAVLLRERGLGRALFVSDRLHVLRVLHMARDTGIDAYGSPTATSPADSSLERWLRALVHELGGLALYLFAGR